MSIRGPFHHVHLLSEDPEITTQWYVQNLGGRVFDEGNVRGSMRFRLRLGDAQINIRGPRPGETIVPRGDGNSVGIDHFGLTTDKLEALLNQLKAKDVKIVEPIFATPAGGHAFFIEAPDGVLIEIVEKS
jgi:catechol 2,3-dioxygenase-like lactoylglutathione lyase family enzyme